MSDERLSLANPDWPEFLFHMQRYALARRLADGKRVLDCACGEGYGSAHMAVVAAQVTGIDIAERAIEKCRGLYGAKANCRFDAGDIRSLPFADGSFDLVCCFETIEHLAKGDAEKALRELVRVLAPDGILLISTPDGEVGRRRGYANPYHLYEMSLVEFRGVLEEEFPHVDIFSQELNMGSVLCPVDPKEPTAGFGGIIEQAQLDSNLEIMPQLKNIDYYYLFAVCSKKQLAIPEAHAFFSLGREPALSLWNELDAARTEAEALREKSEISESNNMKLSRHITSLRSEIDRLGPLEPLVNRLETEVAQLRDRLSYMEPFWDSRSARVVRRYFSLYKVPILGAALAVSRKAAGKVIRRIPR